MCRELYPSWSVAAGPELPVFLLAGPRSLQEQRKGPVGAGEPLTIHVWPSPSASSPICLFPRAQAHFFPYLCQFGWMQAPLLQHEPREVGLVRLRWERTSSALLRSVGRSAVIYARSKGSPNHPIFMVSPPASSLLPPHVTSCLCALQALWGQGLLFSCPGSWALPALLRAVKMHQGRNESGAGASPAPVQGGINSWAFLEFPSRFPAQLSGC